MLLSGVFGWKRAPHAQLPRPGLALDQDLPRCAGSHQVVDLVKLQRRFQRNLRRIAGRYFQPEGVVIDGQGADRRAVLPHGIAEVPSIRIRLPNVRCVIPDDVSIDPAHAPRDHLAGQILNRLQSIAGRRIHAIGQFAAGEIGVAATHQRDRPGDAAVSVRLAARDYSGMEPVIRPEPHQAQRGRKELGIGSRNEQPIRVGFEQGLTRSEVNDFQTQISSPDFGRRVQQLLNPGRQPGRRKGAGQTQDGTEKVVGQFENTVSPAWRRHLYMPLFAKQLQVHAQAPARQVRNRN